MKTLNTAFYYYGEERSTSTKEQKSKMNSTIMKIISLKNNDCNNTYVQGVGKK